MRSVQKLSSEYFPYGTNNWLIRALLYTHHEIVGNVRKTYEISLEDQFCGNQTKTVRTESLKNFRKIFGELLLQTNCESYSRILVSHPSQVYLSKHAKI